jgi:beta-galactosidase
MQKQSLNQSWRFYLGDPFPFPAPLAEPVIWRELDLPHDWSIELERKPDHPSGVANGWFAMGRGWYQKDLEAPVDWQSSAVGGPKKVLVEFEGVYMNAEVRLNEHYLGRHPYGYTSFAFDLTPFLKYGQKNTLQVKVENSAQVNSRWYSGSGIYRPVWLYVAEPVHVAHWGLAVTTPQVSPERAAVQIVTTVQNETGSEQTVSVRSRLFAPDGASVGGSESSHTLAAGASQDFQHQAQVAAPQLWSPETPALYRLETEVWCCGGVVDRETTTFGIRSIIVDAERGFLLNGQPVKFRGGCVHHDNGVLGAASYRRSEERKVELHKASGFNAIRCAHNPPAPAFLEACDRLGMLVIDEAFDCWRDGKNPFDYHLAFDDWWQRDLASMVRRDRNHPSVVAWSIGNEVNERDGRSAGAQIARSLAEAVRQLDPTRPITSAICDVWDMARGWEATDPVFAALDIGGYNYLWKRYEADHARHPSRLMWGTESFPLEALDNWQQVEAHGYVLGDFVWTSLDYLGESGIGKVHYEDDPAGFLAPYPWHQAYCGDLDLCGFKRPQSYYRDIVWGVGAPLYIAVHTPLPPGKKAKVFTLGPENSVLDWSWPDVTPNWTWPGREGQTFTVDVYSACEQVELVLNGQSLGKRPAGRAARLTASFEVPYQPGELKAIGYDGGQPVAEASLATAGPAAALRLSPDRASLPAEPGSLCYVQVEVVDAAGLRQQSADDRVFFTVKGPGTLAAVGNADPTSTELYVGNQRRVHRGCALVVLKASGQAGELTLRAQADGLDGAQVTVRVE